MQYLGSKSRHSKELIPILQKFIISQSINTYIEPFVGGANVIDKIQCNNKIGYDINEYLIAILNQAKENTAVFPQTISQEEYYRVKCGMSNYPKWYVGLVGFCGSYSAKFFGGYAKGKDTRDRQNEAIRNIVNQSKNLQDVEFICGDFRDISLKEKSLVYCDPPYKDTTKYKVDNFPYDEYYEWVRKMSEYHIVICSEYHMPDDFICIWKKKHKSLIDSNRAAASTSNTRVEKLFIHKSLKELLY